MRAEISVDEEWTRHSRRVQVQGEDCPARKFARFAATVCVAIHTRAGKLLVFHKRPSVAVSALPDSNEPNAMRKIGRKGSAN